MPRCASPTAAAGCLATIWAGARVWNCEVSTIDTALLLAGMLTAWQYFGDAEISRHADAIYRRLDWQWFLNGHPHFLSMGWNPESGFLRAR